MAPAKKRRRCPGCALPFTNLHSHWRVSTCDVVPPATNNFRQLHHQNQDALPGQAVTGAPVILDEDSEQPNLPDDLSLCNNSVHNTAGTTSLEDPCSSITSQPAPDPALTVAIPGLDADDLYEMFITDCSNRTTEGLSPHSSRTTSPLPNSAAASESLFDTAVTPQRAEDLHGSLPLSGPSLPSVVAYGLDSGSAFTVPPDLQKAQHCFTDQDRSLMKLYNVCDQADCPRYLMDKVLAQLKFEMTMNNFDPTAPSITKTNTFMARMHHKFPNPPPEANNVQLESFPDPVTIYRFDAIQQMKAHLVRPDLYGNLEHLNVNPNNRWDQSVPSCSTHMREVTDSPWFKDNVAEANGHNRLPSDLEGEGPGPTDIGYIPFLFPAEQYQDATGNDHKESSSLEPVMIGSGLLSSSFNGDPSSRLIIGYIPSFTKKKATPGKTKK